jgi:hypothetical protein
MDQSAVFNGKWIPLVCAVSTMLDTPSYILNVMEELQGDSNGVEVVIFQGADVVGSRIAGHYVSLCTAQDCVQQWTEFLWRGKVKTGETERERETGQKITRQPMYV